MSNPPDIAEIVKRLHAVYTLATTYEILARAVNVVRVLGCRKIPQMGFWKFMDLRGRKGERVLVEGS